MAPAGCRTHRHASRDILQNMIISYITYITSHLGYTTSHALQKQVRRLYLLLQVLRGFYGFVANRLLPT